MAHVCAAAVAAVGVDGAGVTVMVSPTVRETVHATDGVAAQLEELQLMLGEGPCMDAFADGGPALAADLQAREYAIRWPAFTPAAIDGGAGAVFALPLQIGAIRLGALDLYRSRPGPLTAHELADALTYAETAGMLLLDTAAGAVPATAELAWQNDDATVNEAVVHQATGMILVQLGVTAEVAFARLRAYAYAHDRSLVEVAGEVVDGRVFQVADDRVCAGGGERRHMVGVADEAHGGVTAAGEFPFQQSGDLAVASGDDDAHTANLSAPAPAALPFVVAGGMLRQHGWGDGDDRRAGRPGLGWRRRGVERGGVVHRVGDPGLPRTGLTAAQADDVSAVHR
jgi:hypothetical protein